MVDHALPGLELFTEAEAALILLRADAGLLFCDCAVPGREPLLEPAVAGREPALLAEEPVLAFRLRLLVCEWNVIASDLALYQPRRYSIEIVDMKLRSGKILSLNSFFFRNCYNREKSFAFCPGHYQKCHFRAQIF